MKLIEPDVKIVSKLLNEGKVVALPTETVFGLAVKYDNITAIKKMDLIKNREDKIYTMMISDKDKLSSYVIISEIAKNIVDEYMPGDITIVFEKKSDFESEYFKNSETIGIRIPKHKFMLDLLTETGPLLVTSANKSGEKPGITVDDVINNLNLDYIVNQDCDNSAPSTVVSVVNNKLKVLREGRIKL